MQPVRDFLSSGGGKVASIAFVAMCLGLGVYSALSFFGDSEAVASSSDRVYINAKSGEQERHTLTIGFKAPPDTYEAELCYWTKDGKVASNPTYVLTNEAQGKPGPTFCQDCGRLVVPLNPPASTINPAPLNKAEWEARRGKPSSPAATPAQNPAQ